MIYSIGHSILPIESLIERLKFFKIDTLVDVRSIPYSRYNTQFNKKKLQEDLENFDIKYVWKGENLGGLNENVDFDKNIDWLIEQGKENKICVMCSEGDHKKCHRYQLIDEALKKKNESISHIGHGDNWKITKRQEPLF